MRVHRLQNPFEHWRSGLLAEVVLIAVFLAFLTGGAILLVAVT